MLMRLGGAKYHRLTGKQPVFLLSKLNLQLISSPVITLFILIVFLVFPIGITPAKADSSLQTTAIRIGITPVILDQQINFLNKWKSYLETHLKQPVEFIQKDSYGKITTHLLKGELDFGWICGYPYVQHKAMLDLIAVPVYKGKPLYQSYLIVSNTDTSTNSLLDLKDTVFAYSDPDSNSGYLYGQYTLTKAKIDPDTFFKKTFFTWQHKNTVEAVAVGLAQAGIIDSYIWETMKKQQHPLIEKTRVAHKSSEFAFPPLVTTKNAPPHLKKIFLHTLLSMEQKPQGQRLLEELNIDGFIPGNDQLYDDILKMHLFLENGKHNAS